MVYGLKASFPDFFSYIFENDINNEVTFVCGFVNNPGKKKHHLYKQLDLIVKNLERE